ncbi:hypothetical protein PG996_014217 [Apiospora saccharicola]|uniref:BZIP domain-containing protein n=1 Tax=Apiospora saccharicola TaxID=335842 RepID=A0ABR1THP9_9PEZI
MGRNRGREEGSGRTTGGQSKSPPDEVEELYADLEDDLIDDQPPVLYDPLEQIIHHHQQQQSTRRLRNNNNNNQNVRNPFLHQPSNFNQIPFQQRRQQILQQQQQQQQAHQRHLQHKDQYGCNDCRAVRKANVRLRNALHNQIKAVTATLAEWSKEVGVPFGGEADEEMDWQPEPEIRVVFVPQQQQYHNPRQGDSRSRYNDAGGELLPTEYPGAPQGRRYVGYGEYDGYGAYSGHPAGVQGILPGSSVTGGGIPAAPSWHDPEVSSQEGSEEETVNGQTADPYQHQPQPQPMALEPDPFQAPVAPAAPVLPTRSSGSMVVGPDPFQAPRRGSGFAVTDGGPPIGMFATQGITTNPSYSSSSSSSSGVVENLSATSPFSTLAGMTSAPSTGVGNWRSQMEEISPEVSSKYRGRY